MSNVAGCGKARHGLAMFGAAWYGAVWTQVIGDNRGSTPLHLFARKGVRRGRVWCGESWSAEVRRGKERRGEAWIIKSI